MLSEASAIMPTKEDNLSMLHSGCAVVLPVVEVLQIVTRCRQHDDLAGPTSMTLAGRSLLELIGEGSLADV